MKLTKHIKFEIKFEDELKPKLKGDSDIVILHPNEDLLQIGEFTLCD